MKHILPVLLLCLVHAPKSAFAEADTMVTDMLACLHNTQQGDLTSAGHFDACVSAVSETCNSADFVDGAHGPFLSTVTCFSVISGAVEAEMDRRLAEDWPDPHSYGHQWQALANEWAKKRSILNCEYHTEMNIGLREPDDPAELEHHLKFKERHRAICRFFDITHSYWRVVVHRLES